VEDCIFQCHFKNNYNSSVFVWCEVQPIITYLLNRGKVQAQTLMAYGKNSNQ